MFDFQNEERDVTALPLEKAFPITEEAPDIFAQLLALLRLQEEREAA